jgi:hypothetical protein
MRILKSGLATAIAIGLLAGSAVTVAAQDGAGSAYVTGTLAVDGGNCTEDNGEWNECPMSLEASDPRLSGEGSVRNAGVPLPSDEVFIVLVAQSLRIANAEGAWTGGGWLYAVPSEDEGGVGQDEPTWVLTGEGGYEGLTAVLRPDFSEEGSFGGVIVEAEAPAAPPVPEG